MEYRNDPGSRTRPEIHTRKRDEVGVSQRSIVAETEMEKVGGSRGTGRRRCDGTGDGSTGDGYWKRETFQVRPRRVPDEGVVGEIPCP